MRLTLACRWLILMSAGSACAPASPLEPTDSWPADFVLEAPEQLVQLSRLHHVEGDLVLRTTAGLDVLSLPDLVAVDGNVRVEGLPTLGVPVRIELPALLRLGGGIQVRGVGDPATLSAPRVGRIDHLRLGEGRFAVELDALLVVRGDLRVEDAELEGLSLPALEQIEGELLLRRIRSSDPEGAASIRIDLPALSGVGRGLTVRGTTPLELLAPRLVSLGGDLDLDGARARLALDALTEIDGHLRVEESTFDLELPTLVRIRGRISIHAGVFDAPPRVERRRSLYIPALETVEGSIEVGEIQGLEGFETPALQAVGNDVRLFASPPSSAPTSVRSARFRAISSSRTCST